jgi:glucokinase
VPLAIGLDIGGTKVAGGLVDDDGRVVARARRDTPDRSNSPAVVEDTIVGVVDELLDAAASTVVGAGIGAAGFVDASRSTVVFSPHLSWRDEPLREALERRVPVPVVVDNDANVAALAESRYGAGRGESHLVLVNLGTGIGGGIVIDGAVMRGRHGMSGEFGHMMVVPGGQRCECGNRGCWEQYASGNALVREAQALMLARSPVITDLAARVGGVAADLTGPIIAEAARDGDPTAVELFAEIGHWLGLGLADLVAALDPGTFVIGGGVSLVGDLLLNPARESFRRQLVGRGHRPEARIVVAALGNEGGLIGAATLAREEVAAR